MVRVSGVRVIKKYKLQKRISLGIYRKLRRFLEQARQVMHKRHHIFFKKFSEVAMEIRSAAKRAYSFGGGLSSTISKVIFMIGEVCDTMNELVTATFTSWNKFSSVESVEKTPTEDHIIPNKCLGEKSTTAKNVLKPSFTPT